MSINGAGNNGSHINFENPQPQSTQNTTSEQKSSATKKNPKAYSPSTTYIPEKPRTETKNTDLSSRTISEADPQDSFINTNHNVLTKDLLKLKVDNVMLQNLPQLIAAAENKNTLKPDFPIKVHYVLKTWDEKHKKETSVKIQLLPHDPTAPPIPKEEKARINKSLINTLNKFKEENDQEILSLVNKIQVQEAKLTSLLEQLDKHKQSKYLNLNHSSTIRLPLASKQNGSNNSSSEFFEAIVDLKANINPENSKIVKPKKINIDHSLSFNSSHSHATDNEIDKIADINIQRLGGFAKDCQYLLKEQRDGWHVAYAPPVTSNSGLPIHAYLSEDQNFESFIRKPYQGNFALNEVKSKLQNKGDKAKIIFPFLSVSTMNVHSLNNHYVTIEIQIEKKEDNTYSAICYSHDPAGGKSRLPLSNQKNLSQSIQSIFKNETISFKNEVSPYSNIVRQGFDDSASCGYICIDECIKLLKNVPLSEDPRYFFKAKDLRKEQRTCLKQDSKERDDDEKQTNTAPEHTTQHKPQLANSSQINQQLKDDIPQTQDEIDKSKKRLNLTTNLSSSTSQTLTPNTSHVDSSNNNPPQNTTTVTTPNKSTDTVNKPASTTTTPSFSLALAPEKSLSKIIPPPFLSSNFKVAYLSHLSGPEQSKIFNKEQHNYKPMGSVNSGNESLNIGGTGINETFKKEINPTNSSALNSAFQKMHQNLLKLTPKGSISFNDVTDQHPETNTHFSTTFHRNLSKKPNSYEGTVFIDVWDTNKEEKKLKGPHKNKNNRAMIYIVPPKIENYETPDDFLDAVERTATGIIFAVNKHNVKMREKLRHMDLIPTVRMCEFSTDSISDKGKVHPQWVFESIQKGISVGLAYNSYSETGNTIKEIQIPFEIHRGDAHTLTYPSLS